MYRYLLIWVAFYHIKFLCLNKFGWTVDYTPENYRKRILSFNQKWKSTRLEINISYHVRSYFSMYFYAYVFPMYFLAYHGFVLVMCFMVCVLFVRWNLFWEVAISGDFYFVNKFKYNSELNWVEFLLSKSVF